MRFSALSVLAAIFALIGVSALAVYVATLPTTFRVAVGPLANENVRVMVAAKEVLAREREPFRLKLVLTEGSRESAAALDADRADLAVVRTDVAFPNQGGTVAIVRRDLVLLLAPANGPIRSVPDLAGRTVAFVRENPGNAGLLNIILTQTGVDPATVQSEVTRLQDLKVLFAARKVDVVMVVGPPTERAVADALSMVDEIGGGPARILPLDEAEAIAQRWPLIESATLVRGIFGGAPPRPADDVDTIAVAHRLVARRSLGEDQIADFTRVLLNAKARIAADAPLASRIEAPENDKSAAVPIHSGTVAYIDGEVYTFLERYGDWLYLGVMGLGLGGSFLAAFFSLRNARARGHATGLLRGLQGLVGEARDAENEESLDALEARADSIFAETIGDAAESRIDSTLLIAFFIAFEQVRRAISEQRRYLASH